MIKNIILLTKISTRNAFEKFRIFDKNKKTINKKSIYVWLILVVLIAITYLSNEILNILEDYRQTNIFLDGIFTIIMIIMFMQIIISCMNILYFSKDVEYFLMFPIKTKELLLSRICTMLNISYLTEGIFLLIPLILYGISTMASYTYYVAAIIAILLLPMFPVILVSIVFLIIMKFKKQIKNKNQFQMIVTVLFIGIIFLLEILFIRGIISPNVNYQEMESGLETIFTNINASMLVVNPLINILEKNNVLINIFKVLGIYAIMYIILICIGNKVYINNILKTKGYIKSKIKKKVDLEKSCKLQKVSKAYIKNDFKNLFGNTTFFMQIMYPICMTMITILVIAFAFRFVSMASNQELYDFIAGLHLTVEGVCVIIALAQILFSFINISISAISRQGKSAIFMKYIPIDLYKQVWLKNMPQSIISTMISIVLLIAIKIVFISVTWLNVLCLLPICIIIGILNSYIMLVVDIKRPIMNWNTEIEVLKQNGNKVFQYVWTIVVILSLMYSYNIFENVNIYIAILILSIVFTLVLWIFNIYVKKQIKNNKLFKNII